MRLKFEATDVSGKVHKRSSTSHIYSHCLVIHLAAHPPSNLWPKGIAACSHAEWAASPALAERNAHRWRKDPCVEAIRRPGRLREEGWRASSGKRPYRESRA
jgi:hypothetical protein